MKTAWIGALVIAAGLLTVGAVQGRALARLRAEHAALAIQSRSTDEVRAELAKLAGLAPAAEVAGELAQLREASHDLLKLRNEIRALREPNSKLEQLRQEHAELQARQKAAEQSPAASHYQPVEMPVETLTQQGLQTPESALQTLLWAKREGNPEVLKNCLLGRLQDSERQLDPAELARYFAQSYPSNTVFTIVVRRDSSPDATQLGLQVQRPWGQTKLIVPARRLGSEWKLEVGLDFP